jgi:hypothetical protein
MALVVKRTGIDRHKDAREHSHRNIQVSGLNDQIYRLKPQRDLHKRLGAQLDPPARRVTRQEDLGLHPDRHHHNPLLGLRHTPLPQQTRQRTTTLKTRRQSPNS